MESKHTWLGIASFVLSMLTGASTCGLFALVAIGRAAGHVAQHDHKVAQVILAICLILLVLTNLLALGLGIAGLAQTERKRLFAVLGTVFASLQIAGMLLLIAGSH
jgi:hypothetical protein